MSWGKTLTSKGFLKTPKIIEAFESVRREDFLLPKYKNLADIDKPLPIGHAQTNSQPTTVAIMMELLRPQKGDKVLDVGSGSGWTTALLAHIVGEKGRVVGTELIPELTRFGQENLSKYDFSCADIYQTNSQLGWQKEAPYDKILISASADELPIELLGQLKIGGTLVIPIKYSVFTIVKKSADEFEECEYPGFAFVPLR